MAPTCLIMNIWDMMRINCPVSLFKFCFVAKGENGPTYPTFFYRQPRVVRRADNDVAGVGSSTRVPLVLGFSVTG